VLLKSKIKKTYHLFCESAMSARMGIKVLFLDDNEDLRLMMSQILEKKLGVECDTYNSFEDLLSHFDDVMKSKLAILDINLGLEDVTGLDAYRWLKENNFEGKIVFLTGHDNSNALVAEARSIGAEILQKPIPTDKIVNLARNLIA
jgi:DNA-binding NtrC family response regulator